MEQIREAAILKKAGWSSASRLVRWVEIGDAAFSLIVVTADCATWSTSLWCREPFGCGDWEESQFSVLEGTERGPSESVGIGPGIGFVVGTETPGETVFISVADELQEVVCDANVMFLFVTTSDVACSALEFGRYK